MLRLNAISHRAKMKYFYTKKKRYSERGWQFLVQEKREVTKKFSHVLFGHVVGLRAEADSAQPL